jgi:3-methyladenine DNA glycosylase AlkD
MKADFAEIIREMQALANPSALEGMARFGIDTTSALGLSVPAIRAIARRARQKPGSCRTTLGQRSP